MIVDVILDRENGKPYDVSDMYRYLVKSYPGIAEDFYKAMNDPSPIRAEHLVRQILVNYLLDGEYGLNIVAYVLSVAWAVSDSDQRKVAKMIRKTHCTYCTYNGINT